MEELALALDAFEEDWTWDLPGSLEPLAEPVTKDGEWDGPKVLHEAFPEAGLTGAEGTERVCPEESVEESVEDTVSFSWPASLSARGLDGDFTCPSGAESRLLWLQREGHGGKVGLAELSGPGASSAARAWDGGC